MNAADRYSLACCFHSVSINKKNLLISRLCNSSASLVGTANQFTRNVDRKNLSIPYFLRLTSIICPYFPASDESYPVITGAHYS